MKCQSQSGRLVPPGDAAGFAQAVLEMLASPPIPEACRAYAQRFAWGELGYKVMGELEGA